VQSAVEAVRSVWCNPDMRAPLMESLSGIEEFGITFRECREIVRKSVIEKQLNELEAQRLKILADMEQLRKGRDDLRAQLKQEIRRDEAAAFADAVRKSEDARARQAEYEAKAEQARSAAMSAQEALDALANGELERKLCEFANNSRILEQLERIRSRQTAEDVAACAGTEYEQISPEDLVQRIADSFAAEGWCIDAKTAANFAACLAIGNVTVLSGPAGSGKTGAARLFADALGWKNAGRFAAFGPGRKTLENSLTAFGEGPAMILLDDANTVPGDPLRGITGEEWKLCVAVQDAGAGLPINANLLDKGFMIRLSRPASDVAWQPIDVQPAVPFTPADAAALRTAFRELAAERVPQQLVARMNNMRRSLAEQGVTLSRRALDDTWYFCGAMVAILKEAADIDEIFDLAVAQRILPALLASAPIEVLVEIKKAAKNMPHCLALLSQPLPVMV